MVPFYELVAAETGVALDAPTLARLNDGAGPSVPARWRGSAPTRSHFTPYWGVSGLWSSVEGRCARSATANQARLVVLQQQLKDAEENAGESEVRDAIAAHAEHYALIGDKVRAESRDPSVPLCPGPARALLMLILPLWPRQRRRNEHRRSLWSGSIRRWPNRSAQA